VQIRNPIHQAERSIGPNSSCFSTIHESDFVLTLCSEETKFLAQVRSRFCRNIPVRLQSVNYRSRVARSRALAYVLLALIGFSSTLGLTHRHGSHSRNPSQTTFFTETSDSAKINVPSSTTQEPARPGDCLVCQFQRTLSNAEIFTPAILAAITASAFISPQLSVSFVSRAHSIAQGRAPPITF